MKNICSSFLMGILLFLGTHLLAQESEVSYFNDHFESGFYKPPSYSLKQCIDLSDAVFEGIVTNQEVLKRDEDEEGDSTYTITYIEVTKVFKGKVDKNVIAIYPGGTRKNPSTQQFEGTAS